MTDRENHTDPELDDFLNGESEINKIYAERESLEVPAHLEFSVKQMARDNISRESISKEKISEHENIKKQTPGILRTWHRRKFFFPVALAASVVIAVTLTVVLFQNQPAQINDGQIPINISDARSPDSSQSVSIEENSNADVRNTDTAQPEERPIENRQLAEQRVTPMQQGNVANDVKKLTLENREQLTAKNEHSKPDTSAAKPESTERAQQKTYEIPAHITELLQNTNASDQKLNSMPPAEVLRGWQKSQWIEQVKLLNKQGKRELAQRYVQAYPEYFPNESIKYLLKP